MCHGHDLTMRPRVVAMLARPMSLMQFRLLKLPVACQCLEDHACMRIDGRRQLRGQGLHRR